MMHPFHKKKGIAVLLKTATVPLVKTYHPFVKSKMHLAKDKNKLNKNLEKQPIIKEEVLIQLLHAFNNIQNKN